MSELSEIELLAPQEEIAGYTDVPLPQPTLEEATQSPSFDDRYEIITPLSIREGRYVYEAYDKQKGRRCVIKRVSFLEQEVWDDVQNERRVLQDLTHANIAQLYDYGEIVDPRFGNKDFYLVTEYVEGKTLKDLIQDGHSFSLEELRSYREQIVAGLEAAHERHIVHRDVKPSNIMITPDGAIKLLDFGIAKREFDEEHTRTLLSEKGTKAYMSPEQLDPAKPITAATDWYQLGVTLTESLVGKDFWRHLTLDETPADFLRREMLSLDPAFKQSLQYLLDSENAEERKKGLVESDVKESKSALQDCADELLFSIATPSWWVSIREKKDLKFFDYQTFCGGLSFSGAVALSVLYPAITIPTLLLTNAFSLYKERDNLKFTQKIQEYYASVKDKVKTWWEDRKASELYRRMCRKKEFVSVRDITPCDVLALFGRKYFPLIPPPRKDLRPLTEDGFKQNICKYYGLDNEDVAVQQLMNHFDTAVKKERGYVEEAYSVSDIIYLNYWRIHHEDDQWQLKLERRKSRPRKLR